VAVAVDRTISLIVNIEPRPGMHVYAPGADDYRIVNLTLVDQPGVKARPMKYPPSELYAFEALDERIPVYQKPFELMLRALVTDATKTLKGRLDYQACDDKICFPPVEVPLSWTIVR
jgi:DsbC/DsbD-like thiol-disulfide interchange protein